MNRRGYSLMEMVIVLPMTLLLVSLSVYTFSQVMPIPRAAQSQLEQSTALAAVADQFRRDAHDAVELRGADGSPVVADQRIDVWRFASPSQPIVEYRLHEKTLTRLKIADGTIVARETYHLPTAEILGLESSNAGNSLVASLIVRRENRAELRIDAVLGQNRHTAP